MGRPHSVNSLTSANSRGALLDWGYPSCINRDLHGKLKRQTMWSRDCSALFRDAAVTSLDLFSHLTNRAEFYNKRKYLS